MSKKFKFQLFLMFCVLAAAIVFFPDGKAKLPGMPTLPKAAPKKITYYKWQDAEGNWHMSDQKPEGIQAQQLETNPNANIIQSVAVPQKKPKAEKSSQDSLDSAHPAAYLSRAKQTMEDAEQARDLLNQRNQELEDFVSGKQR